MQRKNSPQYVINSYQKKSKIGPIILWAIAGIIFGAGIVLLVLWFTGGKGSGGGSFNLGSHADSDRNLYPDTDSSYFNPDNDTD